MSQPRTPAETYEAYFVPAMFLPWSAVLLRHAAPQSGERVLDLACGTGAVTRQVAPAVTASGSVTGLDINPAMLAVARSLPAPQGAPVTWMEGSATALPFQDAAFDLALCQHGLQFFPDRGKALRELRRVLAPDGRAVAIVGQALEQHPVFEALMESVARRLALPLAAVSIPFALSDTDALRALFDSAGFGAVEITPESIPLRFPQADRFVPLAVASSAAAVPAFATLESSAQAELLDAVRQETEPVVNQYRDGNDIAFPMHAYVIVAKA